MEKEKRSLLFDKETKVSAKDIDNCTDLSLLEEMKEKLMSGMLIAKQQIADARAKQISDGIYADPVWWANINGYKSKLGFLHQKCQMKTRELKFGKEGDKKSDVDLLNRYFVDIAKESIPGGIFSDILGKAYQKVIDVKKQEAI